MFAAPVARWLTAYVPTQFSTAVENCPLVSVRRYVVELVNWYVEVISNVPLRISILTPFRIAAVSGIPCALTLCRLKSAEGRPSPFGPV